MDFLGFRCSELSVGEARRLGHGAEDLEGVFFAGLGLVELLVRVVVMRIVDVRDHPADGRQDVHVVRLQRQSLVRGGVEILPILFLA